MKLSIITINYNNKIGLKRTIDSILMQTMFPFEWIIIDGGSIDGSKELIEQNSLHFSYWCSERDEGIYNAMNKGIAHANGDYCLFLNSGDELYNSEVIKNALDFLSQHKEVDFLYGDCMFIKDRIESIKKCPDNITLADLYSINICHPSTLIKSTLLKRQGYDESYRIASDYKYWLEAYMSGCSFLHVPITISRFYEDGISSTDKELLAKENYRISREIFSKDLGDVLMCYKTLLQKYNEINSWSSRRIPQSVKKIMEKYQYVRDKLMRL